MSTLLFGFPLPAEPALEIFEFVTLDGLRALSLCSKAYRAAVLPTLLREVRMSPDSLPAFHDGGSLAHICPSVRHASFDCLEECGFVETVDRCRIYTSALIGGIFPQLTSLHVSLFGPPKFPRVEAQMLMAIFTRLARAEFYNRLKVLYFQVLPQDMDKAITQGHQLKEMLQESRRFLDIEMGHEQDLNAEESINSLLEKLRPPPALEELLITSDTLRFRKPSARNDLTFAEWLVRACAPNLRRLVICMYQLGTTKNTTILRLYLSLPDRLVFPRVTKLRLDLSSFKRRHLTDLASRFPCLEELAIHVWSGYVMRYTKRIVVMQHIVGFGSTLKKVTVPWPEEWRISRRGVFRWHLRKSVQRWIAAGLTGLQEAEFLLRFEETDERYVKFVVNLERVVVEDGHGWRTGNIPQVPALKYPESIESSINHRFGVRRSFSFAIARRPVRAVELLENSASRLTSPDQILDPPVLALEADSSKTKTRGSHPSQGLHPGLLLASDWDFDRAVKPTLPPSTSSTTRDDRDDDHRPAP
ncbi:hypothetical protein Dda_0122 [Drechslerella dactyloides]|uniref:F-box domain-containing protein n=1 Tax=Drechslerella dactyloides TaxID=74499 RepID=A0AAD6J3S6_DREDA|nr:hypothetical protein Dda_0122 [Drechslerella dactyloides]